MKLLKTIPETIVWTENILTVFGAKIHEVFKFIRRSGNHDICDWCKIFLSLIKVS